MRYFLSFIFILNSFIIVAQDFYINVQTGYGFSTADGQTNYQNIDDIFFNVTKEVVKGGFGEGLYFHLNTGYNYSEIISFECGFNYLQSQSIEFTHSYSSGFDTNFVYTQNSSQSINAFIFSPQLVFKLPSKFKFKPYIKTGIAVGLFMKGQFKENYTTYWRGTSEFDMFTEKELKGGTPLGFTTALGTQYSIYKNLILIVDCSLLNMTYRPYKSTVIAFVREDVDELDNLSLCSCFADIKLKNENITFCLAKQSSHADFADSRRFFINKIIFLVV
ncbi:MAG: hypothetical protein AB8G11_15745 [Saprospiraceae bacterium]